MRENASLKWNNLCNGKATVTEIANIYYEWIRRGLSNKQYNSSYIKKKRREEDLERFW